MHSGFGALRQHCPMNIEAALGEVGQRMWAEQAEVRRDVARIEQMAWSQQPTDSADPTPSGVQRWHVFDGLRWVHGSRLSFAGVGHCQKRTWIDCPAMMPSSNGRKCALLEHDFLDIDEPYRTSQRRTA